MKIFISHARNENYLAKALSDSLRKEGFAVVTPESIDSGENIEKAIQSAIAGCNAMIVILSPHSYHSKWVKMEVELALTNENFKDRLLPIFIGRESEKESAEIPWFLKSIKHINLKRGPNDKINFSKVHNALQSIQLKERGK
jgi:hypothetical protein